MKKIWVCLAMIFLCALVVSCGPVSLESTTQPITSSHTSLTPTSTSIPSTSVNPISLLNLIKSEQQRNTQPNINTSDRTALANGNSAFAWDLYQELRVEKGNLFFSPYSLSLALAMAYVGAKGETATQMADTLHFTLSQDKLAEAFNYVALELTKRALAKDLGGKDGNGFRLNVVDDAWGQKDYTFLESYMDILAENFGAGLRTMDFVKDPEGSRQTINQYISDMTEGRIKDLIPMGDIDAFTRLVLTNAIYFNAAWEYPFNERATQDGSFSLLDGTKVTASMMRVNGDYKYSDGNGYKMIEIPYVGGAMAMDILMPDAGKFTAIEKSLNSQLVGEITAKLTSTKVNLIMPKFEFESEFNVGGMLSAMGMPLALSPGADFSGITGKPELYIGEVVHKAFISVDEKGTEAAAASAVIMVGAAPVTPVAVTIDLPFIFFIRDIPTGAVLFAGRVMNPAT